MIIEIALHNFALAMIAYILSLFSCGILGILPLCFESFIVGTVFKAATSFTTICFTGLEIIGMIVSVFGGTFIFNQRKRKDMSLKKVFIISCALTLVLIIMYLLAAYIEVIELIQLNGGN